MPFVLDASVAIAVFLEDEASAYADAVASAMTAGELAHTPAIWPLEVLNNLLVAERRKRVTSDETGQLLEFLATLPIEVSAAELVDAGASELRLARQLNLTAYDAAYIALAQRRAIPLATVDARLKKAAVVAGVQIFKPKRT